ncbi:MAG: Uma2 family endonuclease [Myxococcales bacterium]|nr:Uma2 family endonuclease [Myxococcales bacterium]
MEPGDVLTREDFHARYLACPGIKAELIDGVVYMPSPARAQHGDLQSMVVLWLGTYAARTANVRASTEVTLILDDLNEPKPDGVLRRLEGGTSGVDDQGYLTGPPELVAEIALSSASYDLHQKRAMYERAGVTEYLVVEPAGQVVHWWHLHDGSYQPLPVLDGVIHSQAFPGLRLRVAALLSLDAAALLAQLCEG